MKEFLKWFLSIAFILAIAYGYIMNLVIMFSSDYMSTGELAIRIIGAFVPPIGIIAGYF